MLVASVAQQQKRRVYGSACDDDDIGRVRLLDAFAMMSFVGHVRELRISLDAVLLDDTDHLLSAILARG
jgi:hypothetical protein